MRFFITRRLIISIQTDHHFGAAYNFHEKGWGGGTFLKVLKESLTREMWMAKRDILENKIPQPLWYNILGLCAS